MTNFAFNKSSFDIKNFNLLIEDYCLTHKLGQAAILNMQLICEEFLSNILFPNNEKEVNFSISERDNDKILSFCYIGPDYLKNISDASFLSLKLLRSKTKAINSKTQENKTTVEFVV